MSDTCPGCLTMLRPLIRIQGIGMFRMLKIWGLLSMQEGCLRVPVPLIRILAGGTYETYKIWAKCWIAPDSLVRIMMPFLDRKSTRLNSSHVAISYAVFCLKKK